MYGKFHGLICSKNKIIIYNESKMKKKLVVKDIEGVFKSVEPLVKKGKSIDSNFQFIIKRENMDTFSEKYGGKFIPFNEGE